MHEVADRTADGAEVALVGRAGGGSAVPPTSDRLRHLWPAALGAVLVIVFGAVGLLQETQPVRADVTEHVVLVDPRPALLPGEEEIVPVRAQDDGLSRIDVVFATYFGTIDCTLLASLEDDGEVLGTSEVPCDRLNDNAPSEVVVVDPVAGSAGEEYDLVLSLAPGSVVGPSLWNSRGDSPALITRYGDERSALDRVGLVVDRMDDYAGPWGSAIGLGMLGLALGGAVVLLVVRPRWGLVAVVALVVVRGLLWSALVPPLQGMDEGAHFANVQFIAEEGRLPNWATDDHEHGAYSDSLVVASEAMNVSAHQPTDRPDFGDEAVDELRERDARAGVDSDGTGPAASYPPAYYGPAAVAYALAPDDTVEQVNAIRLWSVLLGAVAIVFAWLFAGEVLRGRRAPQALLTIAVALQPMLAHQFAIVNNDGWVITSGFAALWLAARLVRSAHAPWVMFAAGVAAGSGALGKPFAAIVVVPVAVAWLLGKVLHRVRDVRTLVLEPVLAFLGVAITYGTWLVASRLLGIDTGLGFASNPDDGARDLATYLATQYDPALDEARGLWIRQFWGVFGWVNTPLPEQYFTVIFWVYVVVALAVVAWGALVMRQRGQRDLETRTLDAYILVCAVASASAVLGMYLIEYLFFASTGRTDLLQGRYILLATPALLALPVLLAQRFRPREHTATVASAVLVTAVAVLHLASIGVIARHYYL